MAGTGNPSDAAQIIDKALAIEPQNPRLLADRTELLLAKSEFDAVYPAAERALAAESEQGQRLLILLTAWSAAHLQGPEERAQDAVWAERLLHEYTQLPESQIVPVSETARHSAQLIVNRHFLPVGRASREVLEALSLLGNKKSTATVTQLAQLLQLKIRNIPTHTQPGVH